MPENSNDFGKELDAYISAREDKSKEYWSYDPQSGCYVNHHDRVLMRWINDQWTLDDYSEVFDKTGCHVKEKALDDAAGNNDKGKGKGKISGNSSDDGSGNSTRYLYNEETDLWFDTFTGSYSHYDKSLRRYVPVTIIDNDEGLAGEPESDDTIRLVVIESKLLKKGQMAVVDGNGLTVGRDKSWDKRLRLPEMAVSKFHCQIYYNNETKDFHILDVGSQNGTYLNSTRLSETRKSSIPHALRHLDIIQIGTTTLEVHDHRDGWPCQACSTKEDNIINVDVGRRDKNTQKDTEDLLQPRGKSEMGWRQELNRLKRLYADVPPKPTRTYIDRAERRRKEQQMIRPHYDRLERHNQAARETAEGAGHEVVNQASLVAQRPATVQGVGNLMLQKMGWKEGQSLGKTGVDGITEPIDPVSNTSRAGLGAHSAYTSLPSSTTTKSNAWRVTRERYNRA